MFSEVTQVGAIYQIPPGVDSLKWCKIAPPHVNVTYADAGLSDTEDRLLPTLIECFTVVFCGFLAGRCNLISPSDIKGLNDFTTYFTLPPLIFLNLVTINFRFVNWVFVISILLSKLVVFLLVALVTATISKQNSLSYAGIYGIFATQGNDFGLAYPIVASLYAAKYPLYPGYMYLIAPTSLLFLNPLGFILMEAQRSRNALKEGAEKEISSHFCSTILRTVGKVSWNILRNPIVFVTLLGVFGNFLFHGRLPSILFGTLQITSSAFSASVLFLLGFSVAGTGESKYSKREGLLIPSMLLIAKMLVSPLVTRSCVSVLCSASPDVDDLADYGFMYGMVPTGPIVMLFAAEYGLRTEMMASTMVLCTALFGPVVFVLARMLSLKVRGINQFAQELRSTMMALSALTILSCICIGLCFILSKKMKRQLYKITGCLMLSQVVLSLGILLWAVSESREEWVQMVEIGLISGGQLMARTWVAVMAVTMLCLRKWPNSAFVNTFLWPNCVGVGFPLLVVVLILIFFGIGQCEPELNKELPLFIYGTTEAAGSIVVLMLCLTTTTCCLVLYFRSPGNSALDETPPGKRGEGNDSPLEDRLEMGKEGLSADLIGGAEVAICKMIRIEGDAALPNEKQMEPMSKHSSPEISPTNSPWHCALRRSETSFSERRLLSSDTSESSYPGSCSSLAKKTPCPSDKSSILIDLEVQDPLHLRHVILLLLNCISMAVGLTISTWKLSANQPNGLYVAIEFLDAVLNVGQGIFVFMVFIKDTKYILAPISKWLGKVRHGFYSLKEPSPWEDAGITQLCQQFRTYHRENCVRDLPRTVKKADRIYDHSFNGADLVDWLMRVGLAGHRTAAENYGQRLFRGGALVSRDGAVQFHDNAAYLYGLA